MTGTGNSDSRTHPTRRDTDMPEYPTTDQCNGRHEALTRELDRMHRIGEQQANALTEIAVMMGKLEISVDSLSRRIDSLTSATKDDWAGPSIPSNYRPPTLATWVTENLRMIIALLAMLGVTGGTYLSAPSTEDMQEAAREAAREAVERVLRPDVGTDMGLPAEVGENAVRVLRHKR